MNNDLTCFLSLTEHELHVLEQALHYFATDFREFDKDWENYMVVQRQMLL